MNHRFYGHMCLKPQVPRCECQARTNASVCPTPWTFPEGRRTCPGLESYGGPGRQNGEPCRGYQIERGNDGETVSGALVDGVLRCIVCYDTKNEIGYGRPNERCEGYIDLGSLTPGRWDCK